MEKILALLLLSPLAFAESAVSNLVGKTWIESSANNQKVALHQFRFFADGRFYGLSKHTGGEAQMFIWNGAYTMESNNLTIYSDDMVCSYNVYKIGNFYRLYNFKRTFAYICPDLLIKESPTDLK